MTTRSLLKKVSARQIAACEVLLYGVMQQCTGQTKDKGIALALVSSHPGAGVSHLSELLEQILNQNDPDSAIALECGSLGYQEAMYEAAADGERKQPALAHRALAGKLRDRAEHLMLLRDKYRLVLLDCHSLELKTDVLGLAPMLEGVLLVVEGNKTTRSQLDHLERTVEMAGGRIVGCVLNKRTYPIPARINSWMERMGI